MKRGIATGSLMVLFAMLGCPAEESPAPTGTVPPESFTYLGAFRLPGDGERPLTFAYGGNAMTFNPDGDASGPDDGCPGSLFVMGHDRLPYGELPDGNQIAEVSIPAPVKTRSVAALSEAAFVQPFTNAASGLFTAYDELPRVGMQYLSTEATGPVLHLAWGQHFHEDAEKQAATHAWISANLAEPDAQGSWFIGNQSLYSTNGYLFEIPPAFANAHLGGRCLATGRYRDGGWSGQGPSLFAYQPWVGDDAMTPPAGAHIQEVVLLQYQNSRESEDVVAKSLQGYQHCDEWEGGAWITTGSGQSAVLFAGTKGTGAKYWYGWVNPAGAEEPCIETEFVNEYTTCRLADGTPCPESDLGGCSGHTDYRGWWSSRFTAQFILYNPADLAQVAAGKMQPWEPQPYASINIDEHLLMNPSGIEADMLGTGPQRRYRIGDVAYDRSNGLIYVLELFADDAKPVVHVWRVG